MMEALLQAGDAAFDRQYQKTWWWLGGSLVMLLASMKVEAFKRKGGR
jgi:hypothetical protein